MSSKMTSLFVTDQLKLINRPSMK